jgi:hypothetical protein
MCEIATSILAGGIVALFSFVLATWREERRLRVEQQQRRRLALVSFAKEMEANRRLCGSIRNSLGMEAKQLEKGNNQGFLNPITQIETGAWTLARVDLPTDLLKDSDLLRRLEIIDSKEREINQMIRTRENFRIQHLTTAPQFLVTTLIGFRRIIDYPLGDLSARIEEALPLLGPYLSEKNA